MQRISQFTRRRFTYANVMSTIAVALAFGGTATAAVMLTGANVRDSSLTGADVKNGSLTGTDIKARSLQASLFAKGQLPSGAQGPTGAPGEKGAAGDKGATGERGATGEKGDKGEPGVEGDIGPEGPDLSGATHVRVAADGTPVENANALIAAIADIDDATGAKPYAVVLSPGRFDLKTQTVTLPDYVSLIGAGELSTTILTTDTTNGLHNLVRPGNESLVKDLRLAAAGLGSSVYVNAIFPAGGTTSIIDGVRIEFISMNPSSFGVMTHGSAGAPATVYVRNTTMYMTASAVLPPQPIDAEGGGNVHVTHSRLEAPNINRAVTVFGGTVTVAYSSVSGGVEAPFTGSITCAYLTTPAGAPYSSPSACS